MTELPALHIPTVVDSASRREEGMRPPGLARLIERLAEADVWTPGPAAMLLGALDIGHTDRRVLLGLSDSRLEAVAAWVRAVTPSGYTSYLYCAAADIGPDGHLEARHLPVLLGHGVVVASRGASGRPLVGLGVDELREELADSRRVLGQQAGYPVRVLAPVPDRFGRAVDGLVEREAKRVGFTTIFEPGTAIADDGPGVRPHRTVRVDDDPDELVRWVLGEGFSRKKARVRSLIERPRKLLERFRVD